MTTYETFEKFGECMEDSNCVIETLLNCLEDRGITLEDLELNHGVDLSGTLIRNERMIDEIARSYPDSYDQFMDYNIENDE